MAVDFAFIRLSYMETTRPSLLKRLTGAEPLRHDGIRLRQNRILPSPHMRRKRLPAHFLY